MKTCIIEECDNKRDARGLCKTHYSQAERNGTLKRLYPTYQERGLTLAGDSKPVGMSNKQFRNMKKNDRDRERSIKSLGGESIEITSFLTDEERFQRRMVLKQLRFENKPKPATSDPRYTMLQGAKKRAKEQNVPFNLTLVDIEIPDICPALEIPIAHQQGTPTENSPTIDRIIPEKGYVPGNIAVISMKANMTKCRASYEEIKKILEYIERHMFL